MLQSILLIGSTNPALVVSKKQYEDALSLSDQPICRICHCNESEMDTPPSTPVPSNRSPSSSSSYTSNKGVVRIPFSSDMKTLITPCCCSGSLRYVHHYCLQQWIRSSNHKHCELCRYHFKMTVKYKPFHKVSRDRRNDL